MDDRDIVDRRVLIVDGELQDVLLLERILGAAGFSCIQSTTDACTVRAAYIDFQPDILLLALNMTTPDGYEVMDQLKPMIGKRSYFPILVLTSDKTTATRHKALGHSAHDFLTKPFDPVEVLLRVKNLLETQTLHYKLQSQNQILIERIRDRTADLELARLETVECLALAAEYRDDESGQHTQRVGHVSAMLARALECTGDQVELLRCAAPLHDVGKIAIADAILLKPGPLTADEHRIMTTHTTTGADILGHSKSTLLQLAAQIAMSHHECWDGTGYPLGRRGDGIPQSGRIVSVADVFDALTHKRPYKKAWPVVDALAEIQRLSGSKFDPHMVEVFLEMMEGELSDNEPAGIRIGYLTDQLKTV